MKTTITIDIDSETLGIFTDEYLAQLWHVAQASTAPFGDRDAEMIAEYIGREIIRRWLADIPPSLWARQASHVNFAKKVPA